eukprot:Hpha_TRINITY_DN16550_c0_g2::TRINITY_DN16550_c0_g2_i1::g.132619::m.132619
MGSERPTPEGKALLAGNCRHKSALLNLRHVVTRDGAQHPVGGANGLHTEGSQTLLLAAPKDVKQNLSRVGFLRHVTGSDNGSGHLLRGDGGVLSGDTTLAQQHARGDGSGGGGGAPGEGRRDRPGNREVGVGGVGGKAHNCTRLNRRHAELSGTIGEDVGRDHCKTLVHRRLAHHAQVSGRRLTLDHQLQTVVGEGEATAGHAADLGHGGGPDGADRTLHSLAQNLLGGLLGSRERQERAEGGHLLVQGRAGHTTLLQHCPHRPHVLRDLGTLSRRTARFARRGAVAEPVGAPLRRLVPRLVLAGRRRPGGEYGTASDKAHVVQGTGVFGAVEGRATLRGVGHPTTADNALHGAALPDGEHFVVWCFRLL